MPEIIRVQLTPVQHEELNQRARGRTLARRLRDRLEMVRLSDLGRTIPQIARRWAPTSRPCARTAKPSWPTIQRADVDALEQLLDAAAARGET